MKNESLDVLGDEQNLRLRKRSARIVHTRTLHTLSILRLTTSIGGLLLSVSSSSLPQTKNTPGLVGSLVHSACTSFVQSLQRLCPQSDVGDDLTSRPSLQVVIDRLENLSLAIPSINSPSSAVAYPARKRSFSEVQNGPEDSQLVLLS